MNLFFQVAEVEAGEGIYDAAGGGVQDLYTAALGVCLDIEVTLEGYGVVLVDFVKTDVLEDLFSSTQFFRYVSKCGVKSPHLELYFAIF